jgi:adenine deaminase
MKPWIAAIVLAAACASRPQPDLVIEAPRLLDVERAAYVDNVKIVITGDRITDVTTSRVRAAKTLTLPAGSVLLPGLIDRCHPERSRRIFSRGPTGKR